MKAHVAVNHLTKYLDISVQEQAQLYAVAITAKAKEDGIPSTILFMAAVFLSETLGNSKITVTLPDTLP